MNKEESTMDGSKSLADSNKPWSKPVLINIDIRIDDIKNGFGGALSDGTNTSTATVS